MMPLPIVIEHSRRYRSKEQELHQPEISGVSKEEVARKIFLLQGLKPALALL